jgi:YbgC/YbaW family acyl-CoA thioester hydrolase
VRTRVQIRWSHEDGFGHVNNAAYLTYLEEGRDALLGDLLGEASYDFVIARVEIDLRSELTHRDRHVEVEARVVGYSRSSVRTSETIRRMDGSVAAQAQTVVVARDPSTGSARPLTADEQSVLAAGAAEPAGG